MLTFVDTGAWYARSVPGDPLHARVVQWLRSYSGKLITTDYVVDEALTLLRARGQFARAVLLGRAIFDLNAVQLHKIEPVDMLAAWRIFRDAP